MKKLKNLISAATNLRKAQDKTRKYMRSIPDGALPCNLSRLIKSEDLAEAALDQAIAAAKG